MVKTVTSDRLLASGVAIAIVIALASWLFSALGYPVNNLFSAEGLRWCLRHGFSALPGEWLCIFVLACMAAGSLPSLTDRSALRKTAPSLALLWCLILAFVLWPSSPLRGVSGGLYPSPFVHALPALLCLSVLAVGIIREPHQASALLVRGIRKYAILIVFYLMVSFIVGEMRFLWQ